MVSLSVNITLNKTLNISISISGNIKGISQRAAPASPHSIKVHQDPILTRPIPPARTARHEPASLPMPSGALQRRCHIFLDTHKHLGTCTYLHGSTYPPTSLANPGHQCMPPPPLSLPSPPPVPASTIFPHLPSALRHVQSAFHQLQSHAASHFLHKHAKALNTLSRHARKRRLCYMRVRPRRVTCRRGGRALELGPEIVDWVRGGEGMGLAARETRDGCEKGGYRYICSERFEMELIRANADFGHLRCADAFSFTG
jgi:hypothetical protein